MKKPLITCTVALLAGLFAAGSALAVKPMTLKSVKATPAPAAEVADAKVAAKPAKLVAAAPAAAGDSVSTDGDRFTYDSCCVGN